jgi:GR25 family glycosyltransferase involved in LPS biosynthesis
MIEKLYCISLKNEVVRRELMMGQFKEQFSDNIYEIVDAHTCDTDIVKKSCEDIKKYKHCISAVSQVAISYSHVECLKKIYENKIVFGGIIEDDIRIMPNIQDRLKSYIDKNPEIINIMNTQPCVLHLACCPSSLDKSESFKNLNHQFGICFNIINHQLAKLLIDGFYPIQYAFDTYMHKFIKEHKETYNIYEFTALPLLAWDLSSPMYQKWWTREDVILREHIKSTSLIKKI